jgi:hypothetical protein
VQRSHADVFKAACDGVRSKLRIGRPTQPAAAASQARLDAKRQLPPTPAVASTRAPAPTPLPAPSRSSVVESMRRARGQPV